MNYPNNVRACDPNDIFLIKDDLRAPESHEIATLPNPEKILAHYCDNGIAVSLIQDGQIVAIGGVVMLWPGVGESWSMTTHHADNYPKFFHETTKWLFEKAAQEMFLHRLQATVRASSEKSIKWHERIGFVKEGLLREYGIDRSNYWMMANYGG